MQPVDDKARRILAALGRKVRPYREADIAVATKLSKGVVRKRLDRLKDAGLVVEVWKGANPPFWELAEESPR